MEILKLIYNFFKNKYTSSASAIENMRNHADPIKKTKGTRNTPLRHDETHVIFSIC